MSSAADDPNRPVGEQDPWPVSLGIVLLDRALQSVEWCGPPEGMSCLVCGSLASNGHALGCPIARALAPGSGRSALDGAVDDAVYQAASMGRSVLVPLDGFILDLRDLEILVTRVTDLMPRSLRA